MLRGRARRRGRWRTPARRGGLASRAWARSVEAELDVQHLDVRLDLADRQEQLVGDLLVGGRAREPAPALVRAAERRQDAALGARQADAAGRPRLGRVAGRCRRRRARCWRAGGSVPACGRAPVPASGTSPSSLPKRSASPSFRRRLPVTRSSLTNVPLLDEAVVDDHPRVAARARTGRAGARPGRPSRARDPMTTAARPTRNPIPVRTKSRSGLPSRSRNTRNG